MRHFSFGFSLPEKSKYYGTDTFHDGEWLRSKWIANGKVCDLVTRLVVTLSTRLIDIQACSSVSEQSKRADVMAHMLKYVYSYRSSHQNALRCTYMPLLE